MEELFEDRFLARAEVVERAAGDVEGIPEVVRDDARKLLQAIVLAAERGLALRAVEGPEVAFLVVLLVAARLAGARPSRIIGQHMLPSFTSFIIVDLVVANVLLSLGMHMLSPTTISLPFKLLLFVLVDGWFLIVKGLVLGYLPTT